MVELIKFFNMCGDDIMECGQRSINLPHKRK